VLYCHSADFNLESEKGLNPLDPLISINWPTCITKISDRDSKHPLLDKNFEGVRL
jgi:dTDP-4-dehydrorhamnose 3,5-epimerase